MRKIQNDELLFLPLGGSNEIGMNVNLYHYKGKWLMIDLGAGFADERFPGVQMLAPDLSFVYERLKDVEAIVLTHAHEDHLGSVGYLWDQLRLPIYATPFTAAMVRHKLRQEGVRDSEFNITEVDPGSRFNIGPFSLQMIQITHSAPEMNAIVLRTEHGNVLHTGDWKFDPDPVAGDASDEAALKALGDEGVLAMVCDSTNVFNDRFSGSEGELKEHISGLISGAKGMVAVTTFASNVARIITIAKAAQENGRKVVLAGLSLHRITTIANETGYLQDVAPFLSEEEAKRQPRDKLLVICTGCQGEPNAAMTKIASGNHPFIRLTPKDTVIFSSKIIPGNEKKIFRLFNRFVRLGCEVYTEKDHFVHVSGHPSREELKRMYEWVRPEIAIPVHGEPTHLHEHTKLARSLGVPSQVEIQNGEVVKLAPGKPESIAHVEFGYLGVDGLCLQPEGGTVMKMRRRLQHEGIVIVSLALTVDGALATDPSISTPGVIDEKTSRNDILDMQEELIDVIEAQRHGGDDTVQSVVRKTVRRMIKERCGKSTTIDVHIHRV